MMMIMWKMKLGRRMMFRRRKMVLLRMRMLRRMMKGR